MKKKIILLLLTILLSLHTMAGGYVVSILPSATTICQGDSVTFTATISGCANFSVQWIVNGINVGTNSTAYSTNTLATCSQSVSCIVSSSSCSGSPVVSNTVVVTVYICTGINEIEKNISFTIYPNPTTGIFTLQTNSNINNTIVMITNTLGEKIYENKITSARTEIDFSEQPAGIYFAEIKTAKQIFRKKIIKQ